MSSDKSWKTFQPQFGWSTSSCAICVDHRDFRQGIRAKDMRTTPNSYKYPQHHIYKYDLLRTTFFVLG